MREMEIITNTTKYLYLSRVEFILFCGHKWVDYNIGSNDNILKTCVLHDHYIKDCPKLASNFALDGMTNKKDTKVN